MRIGVFGGSFDPVHEGHLRPVEAAAVRFGLSRVLYVPARRSPDKVVAPTDARHRVAMLALALSGRPDRAISFEELDREPPSFTVDTLRRFSARWPGHELWLLMGTDALAGFGRWKEPAEIVRLARIAAFRRGPLEASGIEIPPVPDLVSRLEVFDAGSVTISSTGLREALERGESAAGRVPAAVAEYITKHGLYSGGVTQR